MSAKQDQRDMEKVTRALSPEHLANLEGRAILHGLPKDAWLAIPGARMDALQWATTAVANQLLVRNPEWGWTRCLDEAEDTLVSRGINLARPPKSVRKTFTRWLKAAGLWEQNGS